MMATTHAFVGVALGVLATPLLGEIVATPLVLAAAFVGGVAPDADLLAVHRRTLHFPVGYTVLAVGLAALTAAVPVAPLALVTVAATAAAVHALSDVLGGSPERRPWDPSLDIAVYNHALGRWHRPRRLVRYSGAPEDFLVGGAFALAAVFSPVTGPTAETLLVALLVGAGLYTLLRRRLRSDSVVIRRLTRGLPTVRVVERPEGGTTLSFER